MIITIQVISNLQVQVHGPKPSTLLSSFYTLGQFRHAEHAPSQNEWPKKDLFSTLGSGGRIRHDNPTMKIPYSEDEFCETHPLTPTQPSD